MDGGRTSSICEVLAPEAALARYFGLEGGEAIRAGRSSVRSGKYGAWVSPPAQSQVMVFRAAA